MCKLFKPFILILTFSASIISLHAQSVTMYGQYGGTSDEIGYSIITDASGNIYTIGLFNGTTDFDPGVGVFNLTSKGGQDVYVTKLDASGNFIWSKQFGGTLNDVGRSVVVDPSGNILITGYFAGTADFDPGLGEFNLTAVGGSNAFICKLNTAGNLIWAERIGGGEGALSMDIAVDANFVYITGVFKATVDFDPGTGVSELTADYFDVFVCKLDAMGNYIWARKMGGTGSDEAYSIAVDGDGNVYTTGYFKGYADFDPGPGVFYLVYNTSDADVFISKLDASGNFIWAKQFTSSPYDECYGSAIAVDASKNVYVTGKFDSVTDFDTGPGSYTIAAYGGFDGFISKLDPSGNLVWVKTLGGCQGLDRGDDIVLDKFANVYTTGIFNRPADFNPDPATTFTLNPLGGTDAFVCKFSTSGNFIWAKHLGSVNDDYSFGIAVDEQSNVYTTGQFTGTVNFNPLGSPLNLTAAGGYDVFIQRISQVTTAVKDNILNYGWKFYPNPVNKTLQIKLDKLYKDISITITNSIGQKILTKNYVLSQLLEVNIAGSSGIYFVEVNVDKLRPIQVKILKQ